TWRQGLLSPSWEVCLLFPASFLSLRIANANVKNKKEEQFKLLNRLCNCRTSATSSSHPGGTSPHCAYRFEFEPLSHAVRRVSVKKLGNAKSRPPVGSVRGELTFL